jgi:hypothetical protein
MLWRVWLLVKCWWPWQHQMLQQCHLLAIEIVETERLNPACKQDLPAGHQRVDCWLHVSRRVQL